MDITVIDDNLPTGCRKIIMNPPDGNLLDENIRACEMVEDSRPNPYGAPIYRSKWVLSEEDISLLQEGLPIWISFVGGVVPFDACIGNEL